MSKPLTIVDLLQKYGTAGEIPERSLRRKGYTRRFEDHPWGERIVKLTRLEDRLTRPPQEQRAAVLRLWETPLPASDIAYFANEYFETDFHRSTFNNILKEYGTGRIINKPGGGFGFGNRTAISYRIASQIYEVISRDMGVGFAKIQADVGVTRDKIDLALELKETLEPRIIQALSLLTGKEITTPYLGLLRYQSCK